MKAIETKWNGIQYRSRLEARWSIVFDELGIKHVYEPDAIATEKGNYLPDFYFPEYDFFAELKPYDTYDSRHLEFVKATGKPLLMIVSYPNFKPMHLYTYVEKEYCDGFDGYCDQYSFFGDSCNCQLKVKRKIERVLVIPFANIIKSSYGNFWYASGDEDWSECAPFNDAINYSKKIRFWNP